MDINRQDKLVAAFDDMVEHVGEAMHEAEEALAPTVDEMVHNAQVLARELFALTQQEAESLGETLKRDMHKANEAINKQSKEFADWLSFDLTLIEDRFFELIKRAADKTWLDFHEFEYEDHQAALYRSGEVCSAGTFQCCNCDQTVRLRKTGQIPRCPGCDHDEFYRVVS